MRLSIITVSLNNVVGLKRTVASVLQQTSRDFEYIVIDGGSTDGTLEFLQQNITTFSYWVSEPDEGIYDAMNKGIKVAQGKYLLFLNSGDTFYANNTLEQFEEELKVPADLIYGNLQIMRPDDGIKFIHTYPEKLDFDFFKITSLGHPATFIKRKLFHRYGDYRTDLSIVADWEFFLRTICFHNCSYVRVSKVVATFIEDGISSQADYQKVHVQQRNTVLSEQFEAVNYHYDKLIENSKSLRAKVNNLDKRLDLLQTNKYTLKILNATIRSLA